MKLFIFLSIFILMQIQAFAVSECELTGGDSCALNGTIDSDHPEQRNFSILSGQLVIDIDKNETNCVSMDITNSVGGTVLTIEPTITMVNVKTLSEDHYIVEQIAGSDNNTRVTINGFSADTYLITNKTATNCSSIYDYDTTLSFTSAPLTLPHQEKSTLNDAPNDAEMITLDTWVQGRIGYTNGTVDSQDWYKFDIVKDGRITLNTTAYNPNSVANHGDDVDEHFAIATLYSANQTKIEDVEIQTDKNATVFKDGLLAGRYYIKIEPRPFSAYGVYGIKAEFTEADLNASMDHESESNDVATPTSADPIAIDVAMLGQIGFKDYAGKSDDVDWYKFTITSNANVGRLTLTTTRHKTENNTSSFGDDIAHATNTLFATTELYDSSENLLTSWLVAEDQNTTQSYREGMAPGDYYVKVTPNPLDTAYGNYELNVSLERVDNPTGGTIENGTNDSIESATDLALATWGYGNIGFSNGVDRDTVDYYRLDVNVSGEMNLTTQAIGIRNFGSDNEDVFAKVELLDGNGISIFDSKIQSDHNISKTQPRIAKGIYFIKVTPDPSDKGYGSYGVRVDMNAVVLPEGGVENDEDSDINKANVVTQSTWAYSTIGYNNGLSVDDSDYYKVVIDKPGRLIINTGALGSDNSGNTNSNVFAKVDILDGIAHATLFSTTIRNDSNQTAYKDGMQAGTYYVKVTPDPLASGYGTYGFSLDMNATVLPEPKESENNDNLADANIIDINSTVSGMIGYSDGVNSDGADYYKVVVDEEGLFNINVSAFMQAGTQNYGYDNNSSFATVSITDASANIIYSSEIGNEQNLSAYSDHMSIGVYYIKVESNSAEKSYGAYTITQTLNTTALLGEGVDVLENENNNDVSSADSIEFSKWIGGGIGYNSDNVDYYHIWLPSDGSITIEASDINRSVNGSLLDFATIVLFADGYEQNIGSDFGENNVIKHIRYDGLSAGNYYIKVTNPTTYGDYRFKVEFKEVVLSNPQEREPNNKNDEANVIYPNEMNSGSIGYGKPYGMSRVNADQFDYFAMELPQSYSGDINCSGKIVKLLDINNSKTSGILATMEIYNSRVSTLLGTVPLYADLTQRSLLISNYQEKYIYVKIIGKNDSASNYGVYQFKLTPSSSFDPNFKPDFDQDGIPDSIEVSWGLNPEDASDAHEDLDGDGVDNLTEYNDGTDATDYTDVKQHIPNAAILYLLSN